MLFTTESNNKAKTPSAICHTNIDSDVIFINKAERFDYFLENWQDNIVFHFATMGRWSSYELMNFVIKKIGPCKVYLTAWKFNEITANNIFSRIKEGFITEIFMLIEKRIPVMAPECMDMLHKMTKNIKVISVHAKVIVMQNEDWTVTINGSANMTINPRYEAGTLSISKIVGDFHKS